MKLESEIFGKETTLCLAKKTTGNQVRLYNRLSDCLLPFTSNFFSAGANRKTFILQLLAPDDFLPERSPRILTIGGNKYKVDLSSREVKE